MVNAKRITQHIENRGCDKIRILFAIELMREVKLPNYPADPIELRRSEFHESLRKRSDQI